MCLCVCLCVYVCVYVLYVDTKTGPSSRFDGLQAIRFEIFGTEFLLHVY